MKKRWIAFALCLTMLAGCCSSAGASVASLDQALSRWLADQASVRFSATLQLKTLMPFDDASLALINAALKHAAVNARVELDGDNSVTALQIAMDGTALMNLTQRLQTGMNTLETSLLPNRTLTSAVAAPMDLLSGTDTGAQTASEGRTGTETAASPQPQTGAEAAPGTPAATDTEAAPETPAATPTNAPSEPRADTPETSDPESAFSFLDAVTQLQACYQALTDGIKPFATEKRANYNIKGIGAGKWSRVARLTTEQSGGLLDELRAVLSCGMDETYREKVAQFTFDSGFVVALYQNADNQDNCVYMKGNLADADGVKYRLAWQWAFTTNGLKRKDTFKYEVIRQTGTTDSRLIAATCTQESRSDAFLINGKTETTLKRAKITDKSTARIDLSGKKDDNSALTCQGSISQELAHTADDETGKTLRSAAVDLLFTPDEAGSVLSGTIAYVKTADKASQTEIDITLASEVPEDFTAEAAKSGLYNVNSADAAEGANAASAEAVSGGNQVSSMEQNADDAAATPEPASDYLVGTAPIGLKAYPTPQSVQTVDLDTANADTVTDLLAEASQNLAGKLILAIAALPEEDAGILKDGMTDADYAAFQAIIDAL